MFYIGAIFLGLPLVAFIRYWTLMGLAYLAVHCGFVIDMDAAHSLSVWVGSGWAVLTVFESIVKHSNERAKVNAECASIERLTKLREGMRR